ncbi:rod shape-determining protein RodA [Clostridium tagluense]|nr:MULTISPECIES: rod shape-determining protein RodA [Clostridium]MBU3128401.1 rod shape-determining protein RodA [Clostridium tagluense]MBZ9624705.1 rod shape-determining protein RodA [Clostridium sp. FP2]MCB2313175.1 rod shape-determining protein RodA [Clostridium tagluense]MCB2317941.1 rod shape-determining protein RodA [Clostridium tagluense]MCB2322747.1 rod shape-determining protein RodA [Clostridium tagluense]
MKILQNLKLNKKLLRELDYSVIIYAICIVIFGCLNIYSATRGSYYPKLQIAWLILGLITVYLILIFDYILIKNYAIIIYWAGILLLIIGDFVFKTITNGANSWIKIGSIAIQPSEFAKIGMIIILAKKLDDMEGKINDPKNLFILIFYAAVPMLLIIIQPDMGMTMVSFFIVLGIFYCIGLDQKIIIGGITSIILIIVGVWNSPIMKTYWKGRLTSFLNPEQSELTYGLQLIQSKLALGSGGVLGRGFGKGIQFNSVPENHTDFIFAVLGEEWGLIGALVLILLYGLLIYKLIKIAKNSKDVFGTVICVGFISNLLFSIMQNIGMTMGLMPITGITLPFMSYGGSSLLTAFMSLGLVLNVGMRKKKINF